MDIHSPRLIGHFGDMIAPTLIETQEISVATANIDFTLTGDFRLYRVEIFSLVPEDDALGTLQIRTDSNGGASFDEGVSDYAFIGRFWNTGAVSSNNDAAHTSIRFTNDSGASTRMGNDTGEALNGTINIFDPASSSFYTSVHWIVHLRAAGGLTSICQGTGQRVSTAGVDAIQFTMSDGGNFSEGTFRLWGLGE